MAVEDGLLEGKRQGPEQELAVPHPYQGQWRQYDGTGSDQGRWRGCWRCAGQDPRPALRAIALGQIPDHKKARPWPGFFMVVPVQTCLTPLSIWRSGSL